MRIVAVLPCLSHAHIISIQALPLQRSKVDVNYDKKISVELILLDDIP